MTFWFGKIEVAADLFWEEEGSKCLLGGIGMDVGERGIFMGAQIVFQSGKQRMEFFMVILIWNFLLYYHVFAFLSNASQRSG